MCITESRVRYVYYHKLRLIVSRAQPLGGQGVRAPKHFYWLPILDRDFYMGGRFNSATLQIEPYEDFFLIENLHEDLNEDLNAVLIFDEVLGEVLDSQ